MSTVMRVVQVAVKGILWLFYVLDGFVVVEVLGRYLFLGKSGVKSWIFHIGPKMITDETWRLPSASEAYRGFFWVCLVQIVATVFLVILDKILSKSATGRTSATL